MNDILYFVIPCYNEEEVLPETARRLREKMRALMESGRISDRSRVVFVNDGSKDKTWDIIRSLHEQDPLFSGINESRNRGHQNALLAGLMTVRSYCDMAISMDADLQDDMENAGEEKGQYEIQDPSFGYVGDQHSKAPPSLRYRAFFPFILY